MKPFAEQQADLAQDVNRATRRHRTARLGFTLFLILAIAGWALGGLLVVAADAPIAQPVSDGLHHMVGNEPFSAPLIMASAAALLSLGTLFWGLRSRRLHAKIGHLRQGDH
jgi:hypothetical protein